VDQPDLTSILERARAGDPNAHEQLFVALYDELRAIARQKFAHERGDHTLQSTGLVHEAWLRLVDQTRVQWQSRAHFLAVAATAMRRVLVDHARRIHSEKRGGDTPHVSITLAEEIADDRSNSGTVDVLDLESALEGLAAEHPDHAQIVEMRFFGGMTAREAAEALGVTERTAERRWRFARAWLFRELEGDDHGV
jgi:RNA polymerase sigma factor (TIGR02999 family)